MSIPSIVVLVRPTKGVLEPPEHPPLATPLGMMIDHNVRVLAMSIPSIVVLVRPTKGVLEPPEHPPGYAPGDDD